MTVSVIITSPEAITTMSKRCLEIFEKHGPQEVIIRDIENSRSAAQNRLAFNWYKHAAAEKGDETPDEIRAYCKLHIGVPIRREDESFRDVYDRVIRPLTYAQKLEIMVGAIDFPVTRDFSIKDMTRYLDGVEKHFASIGIILQRPSDIYEKAMGLRRK